jgi:hypothetical protein
MSGCSGNTINSGDICCVLVAKQVTKGTQRSVHETNVNDKSIQVGDTTHYLNKGETITLQGREYSAHQTVCHYHVSEHSISGIEMALVYHGANGSLCGDDMLILERSERFLDVSGLGGHQIKQLRLVTAQALINSHKVPDIATFHQMANLGSGKIILSCIQMEHYGPLINDRLLQLPGGKQCITIEDYQIPLDINNGLPYLHCRKLTANEIATLPGSLVFLYLTPILKLLILTRKTVIPTGRTLKR